VAYHEPAITGDYFQSSSTAFQTPSLVVEFSNYSLFLFGKVSPSRFNMTVTQYDGIANSYNILDQLPYRVMETQNIKAAVLPFLKPDMKAVEFACGTGFYTAKLRDWGCSEVTAMDISAPMVHLCKARFPKDVEEGKIRLVEADGAVPQALSPDGSERYFNLAFACWFLNYAANREQLVSMFKMAAVNLQDDGVFVTVVPHPTEALALRAAAWNSRPMTAIRPLYRYPSELESGEGWNLQIVLSDDVTFSAYHLRQHLYEEAARLGGFNGRIEWKREVLLGPEWLKEYQPSFTPADWKIREANPMLGILVVHKN
jgi:SAM-dependent methyltransferase